MLVLWRRRSLGLRVLQCVSRLADAAVWDFEPFRYLVAPSCWLFATDFAFMKTRLRSSFTSESLQSSSPSATLNCLAAPSLPLLACLGAKRRSVVTKTFSSSPAPCNRTSLMRSRHATSCFSWNGTSARDFATSATSGCIFTAPPAHMRRIHGWPG